MANDSNIRQMAAVRETWNSRLGVILAVSGSAVGLGNFLRFPGQAAQYGGGAFMLAYFFAFLFIGLPICWAEWAMGRQAGQHGRHSCPSILSFITGSSPLKYVGVIGIVIPVVIYMYYVYIESWCLGYAVNFLLGEMKFASPDQAGEFWGSFVGVEADGEAIGFGLKQVGIYLLIVFALNFLLIYRGVARGIELFCTYAMPTLVLFALIILARVLTLGAPQEQTPENNVVNGLGFMWNPNKVILQERMVAESGSESWVDVGELVGANTIASVEADPDRRVKTITVLQQLENPQLWLAAAGQIFFSLSVGFGIILTYASYLSGKDDVALSGLTAASTNEFCEVALGGLITIPAGFAFLGIAGVAGMGTFQLGFNVLPMVFSEMPGGQVFGFLFFFLLFLAAVTSSLSMLQPGIAFLEDFLGTNRRKSVAILGAITGLGCFFVVYFSKQAKALDTLDFWVGTFLIFVLATIQVIVFGWVVGIERGFEEIHRGAAIRIPSVFKFVLKYVSPFFLLTIFSLWILVNVFGYSFETGSATVSSYVRDLYGEESSSVAQMSVLLILVVGMLAALVALKSKHAESIHDR